MKRPNILFLFPDQHRGDWMPYSQEVFNRFGMDKLPIRMPNVERLMHQGVTFTRTVSSSPVCAPARACLASGKRYHKCGVRDNSDNYPLEQKTFYTVLKENDYNVGGVGKFDVHKANKWWGLDGWIDDLAELGYTTAIDNAGKMDAVSSGEAEPKDPYMKYLHEHNLASIHIQDMRERGRKTHPTPLPEEAYCDNWLTRNGIQMLRDFPAETPWFLMVNFTGPHGPFDVTERMKNAWEETDFPLPDRSSAEADESVAVRQNYAAMLENIDRNIGLLIEEVERRGELEQTLIIYCSDHGEMLGDIDLYGKSKPDRASVHIPLVIKGPGIRQGVLSDALTELQDLAATILDFAGTSMPEAEDSISLKPILERKQAAHRHLQYSALNDWRMISDGKYKLIVKDGKPVRLYDVESDPWERCELSEKLSDEASRLKAEISAIRLTGL